MTKWNVDLSSYKIVKYPTATPTGSMNTGTSANTYTGTYTEVVAASGIATDFYLVGGSYSNADGVASASTALKIGVGTAGNEADICVVSSRTLSTNEIPIVFSVDPIKISANARVAIDVCDGEAAANAVYYSLFFKVPS